MRIKEGKNYYYEHGKWGKDKCIHKIRKATKTDKEAVIAVYILSWRVK